VGQGGVEGAHGVFHGVLPDATAGALDHAGECAGPSDLAASPQVLAIVHGNGEVFIEQSDGLEGVEVADGVVVLADVSLGGVEEGVEALVGGERGRHAEHQFGVDDGEGGVDVWVAEAHFFLGLVVGNHAPQVDFGAGAGGGGDGDDGQRSGDGFAAAGAAVDIVPEVAAASCGDGDGFSGVDGAAAAQTNNKVTCLLAAQLGALHDMRLDGIGSNFVEQRVLHASLVELLGEGIEVAVLLHRFTSRNND